MDSLKQHVRDTNFSNWLDVAVGISATTKGLSDYLEGTLLSLHHTIKYGPCAQLPICRRNCSKTEHNLSLWCPTCTKWKKQIMLYNKYSTRARQIKWKDINSSEWPQNVNEMVKVFAPDWWEARTSYTDDIVVALHVIHNCKTFNSIQSLTINRVRNIRNALFAHGQLQVNAFERKRAFKDLIAFLKLPEISKTESGKTAILQLKRLKSNCVIRLATEEEKTFRHHLVNVLNPVNVAERTFLDQHDSVSEIRICLYEDNVDTEDKKSCLARRWIGMSLTFILVIILATVGLWNDTTDKRLLKEKDCLSLTYSEPCPWEPDYIFDGYLKNSPLLLGRKWLIQKIQTSLMGTQSRGVMLTAEMGYGKSTLVSHLLCSAERSESNGLRKFILSYHICKFDVISTQRPEYFIKNLAGMLISNLPEAGNAILTDKLAMSFLQTSKCSEDPVGCIDASIIHPLSGLTFDEERYVIIDAIDECGDSAAIAISLLDVLSKRISSMPWWLKFFITARDVNMVTDRFSGMKRFHETLENVQNQNDISTFLAHHLFTHTSTFSRLFGTHTDIKEVTKRILRVSGSNFLYVDLAVKFWIGSPHSKFTDIPQSLNELYHTNLDRVFGDNPPLYNLARKVFEVLCTSYKRLPLEELEAILNVTKDPYDLRSLLGNQISHFVESKNTYISIYHKGICDHLSNNASSYYKYYISKANGHKLFASYLLRKYNISSTDILDMFIHVAESNDLVLLHSFQHTRHILETNFSSGNHLYQMARTKNSFLGTKLLIKVLGKEHINNVTSANVTATFLAAAFGHSETLRALIEEGGDYFFRVQSPPNKGGLEDAVRHCKYTTLWGYGLLDIASQNGHLNVVDLLLSKNQTLLYLKNGLNLNAVHLASEHGHTDILNQFLEINSTLADQNSLYLASKNGHLRSVLSLLQHGVKDTCIPCGDKIYWVTNNTKRMQWHPCYNIGENVECNRLLLLQYAELENVTFVLNDDERLIKCTTALEIAIQRGYKDIVFHLLSQTTNAISCREYGGRTPLLTAIKYNQSEILDIIVENGGNFNEKCEHVHNSTVRMSFQIFNYNEQTSLINDMCPLGAGFEHILAMSGRKEIFKHLHYRGKSFNWTLKDMSGNTPLHYAACNNEWKMMHYMIIFGKVNIYIAATNGSLPIHSAVLCNAIMSYVALEPHYAKTSRELVDNEGRGLFHYLALGSKYTKDVNSMIHMLTSESELKTSTKDTNSSNYLHYAVEIGNHQSIWYFVFRSNTSLLLEPNQINKTVVDVAFDNLVHQNEYRLCLNCSLVDLFNKQQNIEYDEIVSKEEIVVFRIFQLIGQHPELQQTVDYPKYHRLAVMKGNTFILYSIIMFQPRPLIVPVDKHLLAAFFSAKQPSIGMMNLLSQFTSDYCNKPFEESLLHRTIRNENNQFWIYWAYGGEFVNVLNRKPISFWDTCYDRDGYNILHHAIMGGNFVAVRFLIESGMALNGPRSSKPIDLIYLGVSHADIYVIDHIESRPWMQYRKSHIDND
ncbi:protein TANC2-like [Pecten maximus]|uniref:protein TANC2-like n=1 Tax=Pecten maximus TaxID=6579 RepID=UPI001457FCC3|nr:protein TANC2-like [Pecten maximus]